MSVAKDLARWAVQFEPSKDDLVLAQHSLVDSLAVTAAGRREQLAKIAAQLPEPARWAAIGHVLDFDDLHIESTAHISVVCVPAVLSVGGGARAYLAAAGVMARLGMGLGWRHYSAGWHATCSSGALAAAAGASIALGLDVDETATAMALAVPAAAGMQRAFGTDSKSLQVGFAADGGVRAARLAAAGATADPGAVEQWLTLVGGDPSAVSLAGSAIPGDLAIKVYPCCYASQRPISAVQELAHQVKDPNTVLRISLSTPESTLQPLIHHRPLTGLQGKFSLEYAAAAALLDRPVGFHSFTEEAVLRPQAQQLIERVEVQTFPGGDWLLAGQLRATLDRMDAPPISATVELPPGAPGRPLNPDQLRSKITECLHHGGIDAPELASGELSWEQAADWLRREFPTRSQLECQGDRGADDEPPDW